MALATITKLVGGGLFVYFFKATWAGKEEGGIEHRAVTFLAFLTGFSETPWDQVEQINNASPPSPPSKIWCLWPCS